MSNYQSYDDFISNFKPLMMQDETINIEVTGNSLSKAIQTGGVHLSHVWTILDCDGDWYVAPGLHYVNRIGHVITEIPHNEDTLQVRWADDGEFLEACDTIFKEEYGLPLSDTGYSDEEWVKLYYEDNTPDEAVEHHAKKFDLNKMEEVF